MSVVNAHTANYIDLMAIGSGPMQSSATIAVALVKAPPRGDGTIYKMVERFLIVSIFHRLHAFLPIACRVSEQQLPGDIT